MVLAMSPSGNALVLLKQDGLDLEQQRLGALELSDFHFGSLTSSKEIWIFTKINKL